MLAPETFESYLRPFNGEQRDAVRAVRNLIIELNPNLTEQIDEGKWFRGLLTYNTPEGNFVYALGPRGEGTTTFHMMPYYGSSTLQKQHGASLKPFLTGKSCIRFKRYDHLPEAALRDIVARGPEMIQSAMELRDAARKRKPVRT